MNLFERIEEINVRRQDMYIPFDCFLPEIDAFDSVDNYEKINQVADYERPEPVIRPNYLDLISRGAKKVPKDYLYYELNMGVIYEAPRTIS